MKGSPVYKEMVDLLASVGFDRLMVAQMDDAKLLSGFVRKSWVKAGGRRFRKNTEAVRNLARSIRRELHLRTGWKSGQMEVDEGAVEVCRIIPIELSRVWRTSWGAPGWWNWQTRQT